MFDKATLHSLLPLLKVILGIVGGILTWLAYRYRETYWGELALTEFGLKHQDWESESDFQRRRGLVWLWIFAFLALITYVAGRALFGRPGDTSMGMFLAMFISSVLAVWSLGVAVRAFIAAREARD